jgi:hypothetical protein
LKKKLHAGNFLSVNALNNRMNAEKSLLKVQQAINNCEDFGGLRQMSIENV